MMPPVAGRVVALASFLLPALVVAQPPSRYVAGSDFTELEQPAKTATDERIEVVEFFIYGCPHCRDFEPRLNAWVDELPDDDVAFRRVPATFGRAGPVYARIFYTAKSLGVLEDVHSDIFEAIHGQDRPLLEREAIRAFFVEHGVDGAAFDETFDSDAISKKINAATVRMQAHRVTAVPSLGVNGRYWISNRQAGGNARMLKVADFLISRERDR